MKLIFEDITTDQTYNYKLEIESIVYNRNNLDEDIVNLVGENFADHLILEFNNNSKFIKDALEIDDFKVSYIGINSPTILLNFQCDKLIDDSTLMSVLGRYTTKSYEEQFEVEEEQATILFKPMRGELKVYLSYS